MAQLTGKIIICDVPDNAHDFKIVDHKVRNLIDERDCKRLEWDSPEITHKFIILPPGTWRFLFTTKTATEEDARKVVRELPVGARYENYNGDYPVWYHTGKESLRSLLRSKGMDGKNNYALIEKLK